MADLAYMEQLLKQIEISNIPAPAPIEQRWTSASASPMSPAYSADPKSVFSWVGVIMYLPTDDPTQRKAITDRYPPLPSTIPTQVDCNSVLALSITFAAVNYGLLLFCRFYDYTKMLYTYLVPQYHAVEHWAKIEVPSDVEGREAFQQRLKVSHGVACMLG